MKDQVLRLGEPFLERRERDLGLGAFAVDDGEDRGGDVSQRCPPGRHLELWQDVLCRRERRLLAPERPEPVDAEEDQAVAPTRVGLARRVRESVLEDLDRVARRVVLPEGVLVGPEAVRAVERLPALRDPLREEGLRLRLLAVAVEEAGAGEEGVLLADGALGCLREVGIHRGESLLVLPELLRGREHIAKGRRGHLAVRG